MLTLAAYILVFGVGVGMGAAFMAYVLYALMLFLFTR